MGTAHVPWARRPGHCLYPSIVHHNSRSWASDLKSSYRYFKFDTASFSGSLAGAKLRFYAALSDAGSVATSICSASSTGRTESALTWNRRPALGSRLA